jgi:hypothetical protein
VGGAKESGLRRSVGVHSCDRRLARVREWINFGQEFVSAKIVLLSSILRGFVPSREPESCAKPRRSQFKDENSIYICASIHRYMASKANVIERLRDKEKIALCEYFGALKESPLLDQIEADSKKIRENARSRV